MPPKQLKKSFHSLDVITIPFFMTFNSNLKLKFHNSIQNSNSTIQFRIQSSKFRTQNSELKIQNSKFRTQNLKIKFLNRKTKANRIKTIPYYCDALIFNFNEVIGLICFKCFIINLSNWMLFKIRKKIYC